MRVFGSLRACAEASRASTGAALRTATHGGTEVECLLAGAGKGLVLSVATPGQGGSVVELRS